MGKKCCQNKHFFAFSWILPFCGIAYNHVTRGQTMECVYFYSEKQVFVARCQPLELFCNVFIQVFLSLLATVTLVFGVNKTLWHGAVSRIALAQTGLCVAGKD